MGVLPFVRVPILSCGKRALGLAQEDSSSQLIVICDINHQCELILAALVLKILSRGMCQLCLQFQLLQVALSNCLVMKILTHGTRVGPSHQQVDGSQNQNQTVGICGCSDNSVLCPNVPLQPLCRWRDRDVGN